MAAAKKANTSKNNTEIEKVDPTNHDENPTEGRIVDGIYTEKDVELDNGIKVPVSVICDPEKLPATTSMLAHEGNYEGVLLSQLTADTLRILDLAGATRKDLRDNIASVLNRAKEADQ